MGKRRSYLRWYDQVYGRPINVFVRSGLNYVEGGKRNRGKLR